MEELNDILFEEENQLAKVDGFQVDSYEKADWAISKIAQHENKIKRLNSILDAYIKRLTDKFNKEIAESQSQIEYLKMLSEPYLKLELYKLHKKKSIDFLEGRAGFMATQDKLEITDEQKAIEWCEKYCQKAIKKTIIKSEIKKVLDEAMKEDSEIYIEAIKSIMPFAKIETGIDKFYIKTKDDQGLIDE